MVKKQIIELLNLLGFRQDGNVYTKIRHSSASLTG